MDSNEDRLKQSFDEYLGEEIIKMDDLRGMAMTASDWTQSELERLQHDTRIESRTTGSFGRIQRKLQRISSIH